MGVAKLGEQVTGKKPSVIPNQEINNNNRSVLRVNHSPFKQTTKVILCLTALPRMAFLNCISKQCKLYLVPYLLQRFNQHHHPPTWRNAQACAPKVAVSLSCPWP